MRTHNALDKERYARIVAEEKLERAEGQIQHLESAMSRLQKQVNTLEASLDQATEANRDLQAGMEESAAVRQELEQKIQGLQRALTPEHAPATADGGAS